jgi:hypothetical protein
MHQKVTVIFRITSLSVLPIPQEGDLSRLPVLENGLTMSGAITWNAVP